MKERPVNVFHYTDPGNIVGRWLIRMAGQVSEGRATPKADHRTLSDFVKVIPDICIFVENWKYGAGVDQNSARMWDLLSMIHPGDLECHTDASMGFWGISQRCTFVSRKLRWSSQIVGENLCDRVHHGSGS